MKGGPAPKKVGNLRFSLVAFRHTVPGAVWVGNSAGGYRLGRRGGRVGCGLEVFWCRPRADKNFNWRRTLVVTYFHYFSSFNRWQHT